jgi:hypothetical protein
MSVRTPCHATGLVSARCDDTQLVAVHRIVEHSLRRERSVAAGDDGSIDALSYVGRATLHDAPIIVDLDLFPGCDAAPRLHAAGLAFGDEIFTRSNRRRECKKDQTQSRGRKLHDRTFRGGYRET